jgi:hydrocephalus-inducing protein
LLNIHGTCHGIELKLMEDTIGFGVVTVNSKKIKTVQLSNLGDIGAKFEWNTIFCKRYFTISPDKGYLPPNEDTNFTITFHPDVIDSDIQFNKVKCEILGSDPLYINLLGRSVSHPKEAI